MDVKKEKACLENVRLFESAELMSSSVWQEK